MKRPLKNKLTLKNFEENPTLTHETIAKFFRDSLFTLKRSTVTKIIGMKEEIKDKSL